MGLLKSIGKLAWAGMKVAGAAADKAVDAIDKEADKLAGKIDSVTDSINRSLEEDDANTNKEE